MFTLFGGNLHIDQCHFPRFKISIINTNFQISFIKSLAQNFIGPLLVLVTVGNKNIVFEVSLWHGTPLRDQTFSI